MKRLMFLLLAALAALFAILVAADAINLQTDRTDRWAMILGFAGVAFFVGLASADSSSTDTDTDPATAPRRSTRPAPKTASAGSTSASPRPIGPGNRRAMAGGVDDPPPPPIGAPFAEYVDLVPAGEPTAAIDLVALETEPGHATEDDPEVPEVSDDEQINEITALVQQAAYDEADFSFDRVDTSLPDDEVAASPGAEIDLSETERAVERTAETAEPLARLDLRLADYDDEALRRVVKESEGLVIAEMVRTGQLTSAGELTERDIASMVFLSYTSEEMLAELRLRKELDDSVRDQPGEDALTERALAPLKNME